jgi:hypothetical protein
MVTAWGGDRHAEQRMLGRVLQVLYDDAILDGLELSGVLAGTPAHLLVSLVALELEDRARVWSALTLEPTITASPIWIRLRDTFTGRPPAGPVHVSIERRVGANWIALQHRHQLSSTGDLRSSASAAPAIRRRSGRSTSASSSTAPGRSRGIGRRRGGHQDHHRLGAGRARQSVSAGRPAPVPRPELRLPRGTPLLAGRVIDAHGDPADAPV